jgi:hypothetical protein
MCRKERPSTRFLLLRASCIARLAQIPFDFAQGRLSLSKVRFAQDDILHDYEGNR